MPINTRVTVTVVSETPAIYVPTLNTVGLVGTTPGKLSAKNSVISVGSVLDISGIFSVTDPEYVMMNTVLSQIPHGSTLMLFNADRNDYKDATAISGVAANNNALLFSAADPAFVGYLGDNIMVNILPPGTANVALSGTTDQTLVTGSPPAVTLGTVASKNAILFTSKINLTLQPTITITSGASLAISVSGNNVSAVVGALTTAAQLIDALTNVNNTAYNAAAAAILTAALATGTGNDGSGLAATATQTKLVSNNLLFWTSKLGTSQVVRLTFAQPVIANQKFSITTVNNGTATAPAPIDVILNLATNGSAAVNTTAQNVVDALTTASNLSYNATAASYVTVAKYGTADGTQLMNSMTVAPIPFNVNITPGTDANSNPTTTASALATFIESGSVSTITMLLAAGNSGASTGVGIFNPATFASITNGSATSNNTLTVTANVAGSGGNATTLTIATPSGTSSTVSVTGTNITVTPLLGGDSANNIAYLINNTVASAALVTANANVGNSNGSGNVATLAQTSLSGGANAANVKIALSRSNTVSSPSELGRILNSFRSYCLNNQLPLPYFHLSTSLDDVAGDRLEFSQAVAGGGDLFLGEYITTNNVTEMAALQQGNAQPITSLITAMSSARTGFLVYDKTDQYRPDASLIGMWSAFEPGQFQTMWKTLQALPPAKLSQTAQALIEGTAPGVSAGFTYVRFIGAGGGGGMPVTTGSWATDGSFLDNTWDDDWLKVHLQLATVELLNAEPIIYGDVRGIEKIKDVARRTFVLAAEQGIVGKSDGSVKGFAYGQPIFLLDFPTMATWDLLYQNLRNYRLAKAWFKRANAIEEVHYFIYATNDLAVFAGVAGSNVS